MPTPEFILISLKFKFNNPLIMIGFLKFMKNAQFISLNECSDNQVQYLEVVVQDYNAILLKW